MLILAALFAVADAALCRVSFAPQHSYGGPRENQAGSGAAAAATWIFRGDESRRLRRGLLRRRASRRRYSSLNLTAEGVATHDAWYLLPRGASEDGSRRRRGCDVDVLRRRFARLRYINSDGGPGIASVQAFIAQSEETTRENLLHYIDAAGAPIVGGQNTTNLLILDIESAVAASP